MSKAFESQAFPRCVTSESAFAPGTPRPIELLIAVLGLLVLSPLLLVCVALVALSSKGPIFFRQTRVGKNGKNFKLFKFRTMVAASTGLPITAATDSRITKVGRVLRQWKLDELPELYNVLRGDMSFVGPRPEVPELVDFSNPAWDKILSVRPGITDPITLILRNEEAVLATVEDKESFYTEIIQPFKINGYLSYLETRSVRTDIKILGRTATAILMPAQPSAMKRTEYSFPD
jgi:lipopolysaccharide/colanic/teichoic acid biosynthesis glycosyltransferase